MHGITEGMYHDILRKATCPAGHRCTEADGNKAIPNPMESAWRKGEEAKTQRKQSPRNAKRLNKRQRQSSITNKKTESDKKRNQTKKNI